MALRSILRTCAALRPQHASSRSASLCASAGNLIHRKAAVGAQTPALGISPPSCSQPRSSSRSFAAQAVQVSVTAESQGWDPNSGTLSPWFNWKENWSHHISFELDIEVTAEAQKSHLYNRFATPGATIVRMELEPYLISDEDGSLHEEDMWKKLTAEQLASIALKQSSITFRDPTTKHEATFQAPAGQGYFTVKDMVNTILAWEQQNRPLTEWFGGIDVHHTGFAGMHLEKDGTYWIWYDS